MSPSLLIKPLKLSEPTEKNSQAGSKDRCIIDAVIKAKYALETAGLLSYS